MAAAAAAVEALAAAMVRAYALVGWAGAVVGHMIRITIWWGILSLLTQLPNYFCELKSSWFQYKLGSVGSNLRVTRIGNCNPSIAPVGFSFGFRPSL